MISTASFVWAGFAMAIGFLLPVLLPVFWHKKTGTRGINYFIGVGTFILFALTLEQVLHMIMNSICGEALKANMTLYALYGGLAAGIFEGTGRFLALKFVMKKDLSKDSAIMYGFGHAGVECFILQGFSSLSSILSMASINNGSLEARLANLSPEEVAVAREQMNSMLAARPYEFGLGGFDRISALILQVFLSVLLYQAIKNNRNYCYFIAVLIHALVDFLAVYLSSVLLMKTYVVEIILGAISLILLVLLVRFYRCHSDSNPPAQASDDSSLLQ